MKNKKKLPSNSRKITERIVIFKQNTLSKYIKNKNIGKTYLYASFALLLICSIILIGLIGVVGYRTINNYSKMREVFFERQELYGKINFWKSIAEKYPGYPEAYYNIAILYYQLNDVRQSEKYISESLLLNPNFDKALFFEENVLKN